MDEEFASNILGHLAEQTALAPLLLQPNMNISKVSHRFHIYFTSAQNCHSSTRKRGHAAEDRPSSNQFGVSGFDLDHSFAGPNPKICSQTMKPKDADTSLWAVRLANLK